MIVKLNILNWWKDIKTHITKQWKANRMLNKQSQLLALHSYVFILKVSKDEIIELNNI